MSNFIELSDREGNKWFSSNRSPHDSIPVELNSEAEDWRIEQSASAALWSFYILSDHKKKMYVTYNNSNNDVTLEYEDNIKDDNGMRRCFTMLLQPELGLLLRSENAHDRYLGKNNGILEMVTTDAPTYDLHWLITSAVIEFSNVQIHQMLNNLQWKSEGAQINTQIQAEGLSSEQDWTLSVVNNFLLGFSVGSLKANDALKFSEVGTSFLIDGCGGGVIIRCASNNQYVSAPPDNGDLFFVPLKEMATSWNIKIGKLVLRRVSTASSFPLYRR